MDKRRLDLMCFCVPESHLNSRRSLKETSEANILVKNTVSKRNLYSSDIRGFKVFVIQLFTVALTKLKEALRKWKEKM